MPDLVVHRVGNFTLAAEQSEFNLLVRRRAASGRVVFHLAEQHPFEGYGEINGDFSRGFGADALPASGLDVAHQTLA